MTDPTTIVWRDPKGNIVACVEKNKVLRENLEEIRQICQDALEDAVLMECDEKQFRQVLADLGALAESRGCRLQLGLDAAFESASVNGDANALAVLARNLVDNALRYGPAGGTVQVALLSQTGAWLLSVDDAGPGIAAPERERVFARFVRGAHSAATSGSGLGLAIVKTIAERHGGTVALADSALGGLRVVVRLPTRLPQHLPAVAA